MIVISDSDEEWLGLQWFSTGILKNLEDISNMMQLQVFSLFDCSEGWCDNV